MDNMQEQMDDISRKMETKKESKQYEWIHLWQLKHSNFISLISFLQTEQIDFISCLFE